MVYDQFFYVKHTYDNYLSCFVEEHVSYFLFFYYFSWNYLFELNFLYRRGAVSK